MKKLDDETFEYSDKGSKSRDIVDYVGKIQKCCRPLGFNTFKSIDTFIMFNTKVSVFQVICTDFPCCECDDHDTLKE